MRFSMGFDTSFHAFPIDVFTFLDLRSSSIKKFAYTLLTTVVTHRAIGYQNVKLLWASLINNEPWVFMLLQLPMFAEF